MNYGSREQGSLFPIVGEKMEDYSDSGRQCLHFFSLERVEWTQMTSGGSRFKRPLLFGKPWRLRWAGGLKTSKGFEWYLCSPPCLDSKPFEGTFFHIFAFPLWVLYNTDA